MDSGSSCKLHGPTCKGHRSALDYERPVLESRELAAVLACAETDVERAIVLLLYDVPLRSVEIGRLRVEHIDWTTGVLRAPRAKAGVQNAVGLAAATLAALRPWATGRTGLVFPGWGPRRVQALCLALARKAGLHAGPAREGGKTFSHIFRRTRATDLLAAGVELRQVQRRMGHRSWQSTMRYAGLSPERSREVDQLAGRALDALVKRKGIP